VQWVSGWAALAGPHISRDAQQSPLLPRRDPGSPRPSASPVPYPPLSPPLLNSCSSSSPGAPTPPLFPPLSPSCPHCLSPFPRCPPQCQESLPCHWHPWGGAAAGGGGAGALESPAGLGARGRRGPWSRPRGRGPTPAEQYHIQIKRTVVSMVYGDPCCSYCKEIPGARGGSWTCPKDRLFSSPWKRGPLLPCFFQALGLSVHTVPEFLGTSAVVHGQPRVRS